MKKPKLVAKPSTMPSIPSSLKLNSTRYSNIHLRDSVRFTAKKPSLSELDHR
jgi:hypothetical protein